jgi:hypothetical protein
MSRSERGRWRRRCGARCQTEPALWKTSGAHSPSRRLASAQWHGPLPVAIARGDRGRMAPPSSPDNSEAGLRLCISFLFWLTIRKSSTRLNVLAIPRSLLVVIYRTPSALIDCMHSQPFPRTEPPPAPRFRETYFVV